MPKPMKSPSSAPALRLVHGGQHVAAQATRSTRRRTRRPLAPNDQARVTEIRRTLDAALTTTACALQAVDKLSKLTHDAFHLSNPEGSDSYLEAEHALMDLQGAWVTLKQVVTYWSPA